MAKRAFWAVLFPVVVATLQSYDRTVEQDNTLLKYRSHLKTSMLSQAVLTSSNSKKCRADDGVGGRNCPGVPQLRLPEHRIWHVYRGVAEGGTKPPCVLARGRAPLELDHEAGVAEARWSTYEAPGSRQLTLS